MEPKPIWHAAALPRVYLRKLLTFHSAGNGWISCSGSGSFEVSLDGQLLGRGFAAGWEETSSWNRFEISETSPGEHELIVLVSTPRAEGADSPPWFMCHGQLGGDGAELTTDESWCACASETNPSTFSQGLLETHSAIEDPRFLQTADGVSKWDAAALVDVRAIPSDELRTLDVEEVAVSGSRLVTSGEIDAQGALECMASAEALNTCKCVHPEGLLHGGKARTIVQTRSPDRAVVIVVDLGRIVDGSPHLRMRSGDRGGIVELGFACTLAGAVTRARYICRAGSQEWWGLHMHRGRFVVVRLSQFETEVELERLELVTRQAIVSTAGSMTRPPELEQTWRTGLQSLQLCRHETYCASSPTAPFDWMGGLAVALDDYVLTGDASTARSTLRRARASELAAKAFVNALAYPLFLEAYHQYSGDDRMLGESMPDLELVLATIAQDDTADLPPTVQLAKKAGCLRACSRIFRTMGEAARASSCETHLTAVNGEIEKAWAQDRGLFRDSAGSSEQFSQWTNGLVLYFDLAHEPRRQRIVSGLRDDDVEPIRDLGRAFFLLGGLWQAGAEERATECLAMHWRRIAEKDGWSWSDKVSPARADEGAAPGPEYYLGSRILGIRPGSPGYGVLEVRPPSRELPGAAGRLMTPRGWVVVDWSRNSDGKAFTLSVATEGAGETHLCAPRCGLRFPAVSLNGETVWRNEKMIPNSSVRLAIAESGYIVLVVHRSGEYELQVE